MPTPFIIFKIVHLGLRTVVLECYKEVELSVVC